MIKLFIYWKLYRDTLKVSLGVLKRAIKEYEEHRQEHEGEAFETSYTITVRIGDDEWIKNSLIMF